VRERFALPLALGHVAADETEEALRCLRAVDADRLRDAGSRVFWAWLMARCLLAQHDATGALAVAERTLQAIQQRGLVAPPFDMMSLHRVLADAAEASGDTATALRCMRRAHAQYEQMVGRSARARYIALQVKHQLDEAQRERDAAVHGHRSAEVDRRRLAELNDALLTKVAETEMLHARLREQALRDPLTGLHNRRYLFEIVPGMLELARRHGRPLCVVLIDLDHFKLLNDTCGHAAGDLVLQSFSSLLRELLRKSDVPCRHGGEEFVAVMPDIDAEGAHTMLTRLLETFSAQQFELGRRRLPSGTFSAGIAVFPCHGNTLEQLLSRADRALYAAKHQGRARVEMAPGTGFATLG
jgi:diguanylate cyclase (GGDEF)-like protein